MGLDSIKNAVSDYSGKRKDLRADFDDFHLESDKLGELESITAGSDNDIVSSVNEIRSSFDSGLEELQGKKEGLDQVRDGLSDQIRDEKKKTGGVRAKLEKLFGKRYAGRAKDSATRCDALLAELDKLQTELNDDGGSFSSLSGGDSLSSPGGAFSGREKTVHSGIQSGSDIPSGTGNAGPKFGHFDASPRAEGTSYFIQGQAFSQYMYDCSRQTPSSFDSWKGREQEREIHPSSIEGIEIGERELKDNSIFWCQHEREGTMETFVDIARHVPEVRDLLNQGFSLEEIRQNPDLEKCVNIYFDPEYMTRVVDCGSYYEFDTNGRHRILAAREAGVDIPVIVIGTRRWT